MGSPARRLERVLLGAIIPLVFLISITFIDNDFVIKQCGNGICNNYIISIILIFLTVFLCLVLLVLKYSNKLDNWFSKELDIEMRERLNSEYHETDVANLGSSWAKMEIEHLESKHGEE
ncbi:MAG: hypothetical protein NLN64_03380 [Candidatus Thalassarchaeaceae archaeon]|nr:hypothetical protein [Candidatus Thalassarchaeaceae archaeon]